MRIPKCCHLVTTFENVPLYLTTPIVDFSSSLMHTFLNFSKKTKIEKKIKNLKFLKKFKNSKIQKIQFFSKKIEISVFP